MQPKLQVIIVSGEFSASVERADVKASRLVVVAVADELPFYQEVHSSEFSLSPASHDADVGFNASAATASEAIADPSRRSTLYSDD